ncbi:hypothetical protein DID74_01405 [Candidatus Marinamargulisbacteria bacterium SCGC AG-333-B06]|nr:hypothetical protein DID74_01405 [Candidatus Marinamargulisbacteria bacterium SCGC AG-333-B06]
MITRLIRLRKPVYFSLYICLRIICFPLSACGLLYTQLNAILCCRNLGISYTATHALSIRWFLDKTQSRQDKGSRHLVDALPMMSTYGLTLIFFADILWHRIFHGSHCISLSTYAYLRERTQHFDNILSCYADDVEQIISFGSGFDTRCLQFISHSSISFFDCDLQPLVSIKQKALLTAGFAIDSIHFVAIDLTSRTWIQSLCDQGFSFHKKTLILAEGVTPYLSRRQLLGSLKDWSARCNHACLLAMDIYDPCFLHSPSLFYQFFIRPILLFCKEPFQFLTYHTPSLSFNAILIRYNAMCLSKQSLSINHKTIGHTLLCQVMMSL